MMNKTALSLTDVTRGYHKYVGSKPLVETAVLGTAGAAGGYLAGDFAARKVLNMLMMGKSEEEKQRMLDELHADGDGLSFIRGTTAALGGALGAGYSAYKHMDRNNGIRGAIHSMVSPNYYKNNPDRLQSIIEDSKDNLRKPRYSATQLSTGYSSGRTPKDLDKYSSLDDPFVKDTVPLSASMDLIHADPFLTLGQKNITGMLLEGAEGQTSGLASGKDLTRSAIRLGAGLLTGYTFGQVASKLLSLPPDLTGRLSNTGAIAGGLINTGIFRAIGEKL